MKTLPGCFPFVFFPSILFSLFYIHKHTLSQTHSHFQMFSVQHFLLLLPFSLSVTETRLTCSVLSLSPHLSYCVAHVPSSVPHSPVFNPKFFKLVISSSSPLLFLSFLLAGRRRWRGWKRETISSEVSMETADSSARQVQHTAALSLKGVKLLLLLLNTSSAVKATIETACHLAGDVTHACFGVIFFLLSLTSLNHVWND